MNSENDELCKKSVKQVVKRTVMTIAIVAMSVLVLLFVANYIFWSILMPMPMGFRRMPVTERDFQRNKELIVFVKDYLARVEYDYVSIGNSYKSNIVVHTSDHRGTPIYDADFVHTEFADAITELFSLGYDSTTKMENTIQFQRWATLDMRVGVVFAIDARVPNEDAITFLTKIEPLEDYDWYYYEADYNEWRSLNKT